MKGSVPGSCYVGKVYEGRGDGWEARIRLRNAIMQLFNDEQKAVNSDILMGFLKHQVKDSVPRTFVVPSGFYLVNRVLMDGTKRIVYCRTYQVSSGEPQMEVHFYQAFPAIGAFNYDEPIKMLH